jgi:hypothetical protein
MKTRLYNDLIMLPQECGGDYTFSGQLFMTISFMSEFTHEASYLALFALRKVIEERVVSSEGADYLQIFSYKGIRFWLIDGKDHITALLPSEY